MASESLRIEPYNEMWLDCVHNNVMSLLIGANEGFRRIPLYLDVQYAKKMTDQTFDAEETRTRLLAEGFMIPKVSYSMDVFKDFLLSEEIELESNELEKTLELVRTAIGEGFYVFLKVDRFFYPSGRESGKTHLIHPVFVYGYDDGNRQLRVIEDCMMPGTMDDYLLPYESVARSLDHLIGEHRVTLVRCKSADRRVPSFEDPLAPVRAATAMARRLLEGKPFYLEQYDLHYHGGLASLDSYVEELELLFGRLEDRRMFGMRTLAFQQVHGRNANVVRFMLERDMADPDKAEKLVQSYGQLRKQWEIFKIKSYYLLDAKADDPSIIDAERCRPLHARLTNLRALEEEAAEKLARLCEPLL